jgi:hypothetical protein
MGAGRRIVDLTAAASLVVAFAALGPGCGPETPVYDKAANYTPEALAEELILRYRALSPSAKTSTRTGSGSKSASITRKNPEKKIITKTTKNRAAPTIDDLLDDIKYKSTLITDSKPADTSQKMIATISGDKSLSESEKKTLTEFVSHLGD